MITEYLLLLAEIVKRLRSQQRPFALAGSGMLQPWQAWELLRLDTQTKNARGWG